MDVAAQGIYLISKNDGTKARGFTMKAKRRNRNKTKQNREKNVTPAKGNMASANKTKTKQNRPEDSTSSPHLWLINYGEQNITSALAVVHVLENTSWCHVNDDPSNRSEFSKEISIIVPGGNGDLF